MKVLLIGLALIVSSQSFASFNRFWVGHKKSDVTTAAFLNGLNKTFFKDTIEVGQGRGLVSYQPYVTKMTSNVPDELALVIYESEEKYRAIRATPEGERYSAAHWDFFAKETSKSTVSVPFAGTLTEGGAFELVSDFSDWQNHATTVGIYERKEADLTKLATFFGELKTKKDVKNSLLLVTKDWIIEYRVQVANSTYEKLPLKEIEVKELENKKLSELSRPVGFGEGVNFKF